MSRAFVALGGNLGHPAAQLLRVMAELDGLPHLRMHVRPFVLVPLLEIAPDASVPGHGPARALLALCPDVADVRRVEHPGFDWGPHVRDIWGRGWSGRLPLPPDTRLPDRQAVAR